MGCVQSSQSDNAPSTTVTSSTKHSVHAPVHRQASSSKAQTQKKNSYETELSASLTENGASNVAFHGLLVDSGKISLQREENTGLTKIFEKSVHPNDESHPSSRKYPGTSTITGRAMTMPYTIIVSKTGVDKKVFEIVENIFNKANNTINGWNPKSDVSKLNNALPEKIVKVDEDLIELFSIIDEVHSMTDGRFDPTTGTVTVAFENCINQNHRPPVPTEVKPYKHAVGWTKRVKRSGLSVFRTNANTVIDLDGISKGYVIDNIVDALVDAGFTDCYVDWAGDIRVAGNHPAGRPWRSAVMRPPSLPRTFGHWQKGTLREMLNENDIAYMADFNLDKEGGGAIATSGDYFAMQKYGYHHIARLEDMTVMKANINTVGSVCVAARKCAVADAVATAAMTFDSVDHAISFLTCVMRAHMHVIQGFCVMGRKMIPRHVSDDYTRSIFTPVITEQSTVNSEASRLLAGSEDQQISAKPLKKLYSSIYSSSCTVTFGSETTEVKSLVACSMQPDQLVTFIAPRSFLEDATTAEDSEYSKCSIAVLAPTIRPSDDSSRGAEISLSFYQLLNLGNNYLVVAKIEDIFLHRITDFEIRWNGTPISERILQLEVPRSQFQFCQMERKAKIIFRNIPSMVWIITTKSADQNDHGITATSVTIPEVSDGLLCFNIQHSSTFFAALGGVGSKVRVHALSIFQKDLAKQFVRNSLISPQISEQLETDSIATIDANVDITETVQDHLVGIANIRNLNFSSIDNLEPLIWLCGDFLN